MDDLMSAPSYRPANTERRLGLGLLPGEAESLFVQATTMAKCGKRKEAIELFGQVLKLQPDHAKAHHNLAIALSEERDFTHAIASLRTAIRIQPNYAEAYSNLGNILGEVSRVDCHLALQNQPRSGGSKPARL